MGVLEEQVADGYLNGQIWNREEEIDIKPYISIRANQNWAEPGETANFTIRRRYRKSDRGRKRRGALTIDLSVYAPAFAATQIVIPAGVGEASFSATANSTANSVSAEIANLPRYRRKSGEESGYVPFYNLNPYVVVTYRHTYYVYADIFREKWVYVGGWQPLNTPSSSGYIGIYASPPVGPLPRQDRYSGFLNWGFFDVWVERVYTPVYEIVTSSATPPGYNPTARGATIHPAVDLAIYRFCTGQNSLFGQSCPAYAPAYQFSTSPIQSPGGSSPTQMLYQAPPITGGNPPNAPAAWVYRVENTGNFRINPPVQIDTTITPQPPTAPKLKSPWAEDPLYIF